MKKRCFILIGVVLLISIFFSTSIFAIEEKSEIYVKQTFIGEYGRYNMNKSGLPKPFQHSWANYHYFTADDNRPVYCIDFSTPHINGIYQVEQDVKQLSDQQRDYLRLALGYGYNGFSSGYQGYDSNVQRMATQICVWLIQGDFFNTELEAKALEYFTQHSPFQKQIQEIYYFLKEDILRHNILPTFSEAVITLSKDESGKYVAALVDDNNCLEYFDFLLMTDNTSNFTVTKAGKKLIISSDTVLTETVSLQIIRKPSLGNYVAINPLYLTRGELQTKVMPSKAEEKTWILTLQTEKKEQETPSEGLSSDEETPPAGTNDNSIDDALPQNTQRKNKAITYFVPPIIHDTKSLIAIALAGVVLFGGAILAVRFFGKPS